MANHHGRRYSKPLQRLISYKSIGGQLSIKVQVVLDTAINYHYCINYLIVASTIVYQITEGTMPNIGEDSGEFIHGLTTKIIAE